MLAMWNIFRYEHGMNRYTEQITVQQVRALERGKPQGFCQLNPRQTYPDTRYVPRYGWLVGWLVGWLEESLLSYAGGGFHEDGASICL